MVERTRLFTLITLHQICRPRAHHRSHIASIRKFLAEGGLAEIHTFLGWLINTRFFTIALPGKYDLTGSNQSSNSFIRNRPHLMSSPPYLLLLSTLVGCPKRACYIIPSARHFMNTLRLT
eukprot:scaffold958_cov128-Skeletonema_dohrnii-CCMP3373.AAC.16